MQIARSFYCGGATFVSKVYQLVETYDDLSPMLEVKCDLSEEDEALLLNALESAPEPYRGQSFEFILQDFLEGVGIPCPTLFETMRDRINPIVSLTEAKNSPSFHLRTFSWAVGGAPFLKVVDRATTEVR